MPWEVKEVSTKAFMGILGCLWLDLFFKMNPIFYSIPAGWFSFYWCWMTWKYMGHAITKIELHEDGKNVTCTLKVGTQLTWKIKDISKATDEKILVEAFEEPYLFPIDVEHSKGKKRYYVYGQGHEPIKHGEIFRAIINGQAIKV